MTVRRMRFVLAACVVVSLGLSVPALGAGVTNAGDDGRTGWYPNETSLTPALVQGGTFGQEWSASVNGQVYAQPLLENGTLLVATETNHVYGLDPASGTAKWSASLGTPWNPADIGCGDLTPSIGVTSTPVIDTTTNTAYLTHKTYLSGTSGPAAWYMDALDMTNGQERPGFPVLLSGTAQNAPNRSFYATNQLQRPGLLLLNGVIYAAFGSHCDHAPWQGWIFGVSTAGTVTARWIDNTTVDGGGIWQSGAGLTSDGPATILLSTGNGGAPSTPAAGNNIPANLGESIVRLNVQPNGTLQAVDFFAPYNATTLDSYDADFASGGVTSLPDQYFGTSSLPHLAVVVGKEGYVYLLNRDSLGGIAQGPNGSDNVIQRIGPRGGVWSRPAVWPGDGGYVYIPTSSGSNGGGHLDVYKYGLSGGGQPSLSLAGSSTDVFGWGSGAPVITSNGTASGSALVWIIWSANRAGSGGQLRAYLPVPVNGAPVLVYSAPIGTASNYSVPGVGAGRIYVGTRDSKVLAFGSPVTPVLTGAAVNFSTTTIGSSGQSTLTLTANKSITLTALTSNSSQFQVGTPSQALPASIGAGESITFPITFAPTQTGVVAAQLTAATSAGNISFAASGTGQAAAPQLAVSPPIVAFGGTAVNGHVSGTATFSNVGAAPLTINKVDLPAAPFSATGTPSVGDQIAPGSSVTVTVNFDPTQLGTFNDSIGLETTGGNGQVGLAGTAGSSGSLQITSPSDFGSVPVGSTVTRTFTVTNNGGTAVTILKSKPPTGGAFAATTGIPEGTTIAPGGSVTAAVAFTPTGPGYSSASWQLNGDDTTGLHQIVFSGTGTIPAPAAGSWTSNGTSSISGGTISLTGTAGYSAGTSFFKTPIDTHHLVISFDATMGGGTGGDGLTLVLADPSKGATPTSLGYRGGGLAFSGIPGIAVALGTYQSPGAPSSNFVGITTGASSVATNALTWLATSTAVPGLRTTSHVTIVVQNGTITLSINGTQVLSTAVTVPAQALLGFSGASGGLTDNHQVANVTISGDTAPPQPATLTLENTVSAPSGSSQGSATMVLSGSCPSAFTTAAIGGGGTATPALTGAGAGSTCSVSEAAPAAVAGGSWTTSASVNGGPAVRLSVSGGQLTVPSFSLSAGNDVVAFFNTWTASAPSTIPDPTAGGWQLNGSSTLSGGQLVLTPATAMLAGTAFWPQTINPANLTIDFDASITGGTGADGLALVLADASKGATATSLGYRGGGLGFSGIPGIAVALDEYKNAANPSANFTGITDGPTSAAPDQLHWLATANLTAALQGATHHVQIVTANGTLTVFIDGTQVLSQAVALPASAFLGFSAGTGGLTNIHAISNLVVSQASSGPPGPATLTLSSTVTAPSGSPQANVAPAFSGSCPSSFAAITLANGMTATPTLAAAVAGSPCSLSEATPAPAGGTWTSTASVNGGPQVPLSASGGQLTLPTFTLVAGANAVAFLNSWSATAVRPAVTAVSPASGPVAGGTSVTITGSGFSGASAVTFGSHAASSYTVVSDTKITAVAPASTAGTQDVTVAGPGGTSVAGAADHYTYTASCTSPVVTGVSPSSGPAAGGTTVTITGGCFTGATWVGFGAVTAASWTVVSDSEVIAVSPPQAASTHNIYVATGKGSSAAVAADKFSYH